MDSFHDMKIGRAARLSRVARIAADAAALACAYLAAYCHRFNFAEPSWGWRGAAASFAVFCAVHLASLSLFGCHSVPWRRCGLRGALSVAYATAAASAALVAMRAVLADVRFSWLRPPYSVTLIGFVFATAALVAVRALRRAYLAGSPKASDFMEREEKTFDNTAVARFLAGRTVAVTGAGGTIGSEIVRQTAAAGAAKVVMIERCENALYEIERAMKSACPPCAIKPYMADAGDAEAVAAIFAAEKPSVVLHAAACKHVPLVEANPRTGWKNNVEATAVLAKASLAAGVERFVLISTDKAVNPVSEMGRTKREAEKTVISMNSPSPDGSGVFCAVRFGNVFGSSGSVIPLFREQIARGGPVTVTHPDMMRYFMTVQEAVNLVLQAASRREGAIYTLDMGSPVRILDLAIHMIESAGYRPFSDIPVAFTGIRPGEKLFEEIDISGKSAFKTDMAKIYITK